MFTFEIIWNSWKDENLKKKIIRTRKFLETTPQDKTRREGGKKEEEEVILGFRESRKEDFALYKSM